MKTIYAPAKSYLTPEMELLDIESEGLLCESKGSSARVDPWENGGSLGDYQVK